MDDTTAIESIRPTAHRPNWHESASGSAGRSRAVLFGGQGPGALILLALALGVLRRRATR